VPIALGAHYLLDAGPLWTFVAGGVAIVPLAEWIRRGTEQISRRTGSTVGGLLSATFGNTAELVLAIFVLLAGQADVVKAQITGSIIGNGLLGFGLAIAIGTWGKRELRFKPERAGLLSSLLMLVVIALLVPVLVDYTEHGWPLWRSIAALVVATIATASMSELVSGALEATARTIGVSTFFLGVVVLAIIGNIAEYFSSIYFARQGRLGLVATITVGSTIQIALVVAPILVLLSHAAGHPMNLVFDNPLELVAIASVAFVVNAITRDGEATWFEGVLSNR